MILCLPLLSVSPLLEKNLPCALPEPISSRRQVFTVFRILHERLLHRIIQRGKSGWYDIDGNPFSRTFDLLRFRLTKASTNVYRVLGSISRRTIGFRFHRNTAGRRSWELAEVTKSSFLRSLRLNSLCSVVGRASAAKKQRRNVFALIGEQLSRSEHGIVSTESWI